MKSFEEIARSGYQTFQKRMTDALTQAHQQSQEAAPQIRDWEELAPITQQAYVAATQQIAAELALAH